MKKRLRPPTRVLHPPKMSRRKVFADEEAIETAIAVDQAHDSGRRKVFADEEAIETGLIVHGVVDQLWGRKVFADEEAIETVTISSLPPGKVLPESIR